jgi:hypothetical protein
MLSLRSSLLTVGILLGGAVLAVAPPRAWAEKNHERLTVFVNGVKFEPEPVHASEKDPTEYYRLDLLARAMGVPFQMSTYGAILNGKNLLAPPVMIEGRAYQTLDVAVKTVGGTVVRDPVRKVIQVTCKGVNTGGFAYYAADYKTPEEQAEADANKKYTAEGHPDMARLQKQHREQMKAYDKLPSALRPDTPDFDLPSAPLPDINSNNGGATMPTVPDPNQHSDYRRPAMASMTPPPRAMVYASRSADNRVFKLTVRDVKLAEVLKGVDPPAQPNPGSKFVIVYLTEENLTKSYQTPGWFVIHDMTGASYSPDPNLSEFSLEVLHPHEVTSGFIVCQIPIATLPVAIEVLGNPPLSMSLAP